jgi:4-hydroxybenzoate polyprenyltransferase
MKEKISIHLWTLGRWFALPFFGGATLIGVVLAGGGLTSLNSWLAFATAALLMAGGHSFNTYLDTVWTHLDTPDSHSVEKGYTAGSTVIVGGWASEKEVLANALSWYALGLIPGIWLAVTVTPWVLIPIVYGMAVTFIYCWSKFSYFHEAVLASGPVAGAVLGALSTGTGDWINALLVSIPIVLIFSYAGLALDEYCDAYTNLQKGVNSLAYKIWEYKFALVNYIFFWVLLAYIIQTLFIAIGLLDAWSSITFILWPFIIAFLVMLKPKADTVRENPTSNKALVEFNKSAMLIVMIAAFYPILLLVGEIIVF